MVEAAGGIVVVRDGAGAPRVLVVHRPRYDDWSFPKGKLDPGEDHLTAALREVLEETGLVCTADHELAEVRYTDHRDRPKRVRYWRMTPVGDDPGAPGATDAPVARDEEVDELRWVTPAEAADLLSYPHDLVLLDQIGT